MKKTTWWVVTNLAINPDDVIGAFASNRKDAIAIAREITRKGKHVLTWTELKKKGWRVGKVEL